MSPLPSVASGIPSLSASVSNESGVPSPSVSCKQELEGSEKEISSIKLPKLPEPPAPSKKKVVVVCPAGIV